MRNKRNIFNQFIFWVALSALTTAQFIPNKDHGLWGVLVALALMGVWLIISQLELISMRKRSEEIFQELKNPDWPLAVRPKNVNELMGSLMDDDNAIAYTIDTATHTIIFDKKAGKRIKCKTCKMTSYNQNDVKEKFCGKCGKFHE